MFYIRYVGDLVTMHWSNKAVKTIILVEQDFSNTHNVQFWVTIKHRNSVVYLNLGGTKMQKEKLDVIYLQNANPHRHGHTIFTKLQK
jgi:hypothetical protein